MSLRILVDEDSQSRALVAVLRSAGLDVRTAREEKLDGCEDAVVLARATSIDRAVLTKNADDFAELHETNREHSGILAIYESCDRSKNMSFAEIVKALGNLDQSGLDVRGQFVPLNAWNF